MQITLTPDQMTWLDGLVASGEFASLEEAVRQLLDGLMAEAAGGAHDLDWAKPLVDVALASVARGEVIALDDHRAHAAALLARPAG